MTTSVNDLRKVAGIMGENFIGIEEMEKAGATWTPEQRARLEHIPFPQWALEICCKSHILFPTVEDSINELRQKYSELFQEPGDEYCMEKLDTLLLGKGKNASRWNLLRKWPNRDGGTKTLYDHEVMASANTVVQALIFWYRTRHEWLWKEHLYPTCRNEVSSDSDDILEDSSVTIGTTHPYLKNEPGKIWIYDFWKDRPRDVACLGIIHRFGTMYQFINRYGQGQSS